MAWLVLFQPARSFGLTLAGALKPEYAPLVVTVTSGVSAIDGIVTFINTRFIRMVALSTVIVMSVLPLGFE